jgi:hypothetical protein
MRSKHQRYSHHELHAALFARLYPNGYETVPGHRQALSCPYYVELKGVLGSDWGIIVSPTSPKFGRLVFEHDACGCEEGTHEEGNQRKDQWLKKGEG